MSAYTKAHGWCVPIGGIKYRTTKTLVWRVGPETYGAEYSIPSNMVFDVSIPGALQWIFSPHEHRYLKAAALHDHFLESGWDRFTAGAQFHEALKADKVPRWRRIAMALAVLFFKYR